MIGIIKLLTCCPHFQFTHGSHRVSISGTRIQNIRLLFSLQQVGKKITLRSLMIIKVFFRSFPTCSSNYFRPKNSQLCDSSHCYFAVDGKQVYLSKHCSRIFWKFEFNKCPGSILLSFNKASWLYAEKYPKLGNCQKEYAKVDKLCWETEETKPQGPWMKFKQDVSFCCCRPQNVSWFIWIRKSSDTFTLASPSFKVILKKVKTSIESLRIFDETITTPIYWLVQ